jgi:hypothetical protein
LSPTIKRVGKYRIFIWSEENQASFEDPHVHVSDRTRGMPDYREAEFWLGPPVAEKANEGYRRREMNEIQKIVEQNRDELEREWNERFPKPR